MTESERFSAADCRRPAVLLATGFGAGLSPWAPGTAGTLVALPVWWFLLADLPPAMYLVFLGVAIGAGTWVTALAIRGRAEHDAPAIVIDEMVGVWLALALLPRSVWVLVAGFLLFRLFDIAKPWPVSWADRQVPGAWGVMLDDIIAGLMALAVLQFAIGVLNWSGVIV